MDNLKNEDGTLNDYEEKYLEKWTSAQVSMQFQRRIILGLFGLIGILALIVLFAGQNSPIVVERREALFAPLSVQKDGVKITNETVGELVKEFIKLRYEWPKFDPEQIVKQLEPLTSGDLRSKLLLEFGTKGHENKDGGSVEQTVSRIRPEVSDKAVLAGFDRILRINGVPIVVPTQISLLLVEGPKTSINPLGLYVNGVIEHEER